MASHNLSLFVGLENLTTVEDVFGITQNDSLTNLQGLNNLVTVKRYLEIHRNDALISLNGLDNITTVDSLIITENEILQNLDGLSNLTSLGHLKVGHNNSLTSLYGLHNLTYTEGNVDIRDNAILPNLNGLGSLTSIIIDGPFYETSSLGNNYISSNFTLLCNPSLTSLDGLNKLNFIGGTFITGGNPLLPRSTVDNFSSDVTIAGGRTLYQDCPYDLNKSD